MQTTATAADVPDDVRKNLQAMIDWTLNHANHVDPDDTPIQESSLAL